jgi:adenylosuccinate lyase
LNHINNQLPIAKEKKKERKRASMIDRYQTEEMKALFREDQRFQFMLMVEKTVAQVQSEMGLIPQKAFKDIQSRAQIDLKRILKIEEKTKHDVIAFVTQISERVGENGKYVHFGLTSSDVLDTALSLQTVTALDIILKELSGLKKTIKRLALKHKNSLCPGRTHGIYAEITTFGFKMMGFLSEISRAEKRIKLSQSQIRICKLSGAVGTSSALGLDVEEKVARLLKLKVEPFATQVIPRDRHAEVFTALAFLAACLERLSIELRHLQRTEVSEVIEGFDLGQKGSSAMPHKKNPISAENITGLSRLIKGYMNVAIDNIPLWHERDISHSSNERIIMQDSMTATHYCLRRMNRLLQNLYIDHKTMLANTYKAQGKLYSSHVLNHLIAQNMDREKAYSLIQKLSFDLKPNQSLKDAIEKSIDLKSYFSDQDLNTIFSGKKYLTAIQKRIKKYAASL